MVYATGLSLVLLVMVLRVLALRFLGVCLIVFAGLCWERFVGCFGDSRTWVLRFIVGLMGYRGFVFLIFWFDLVFSVLLEHLLLGLGLWFALPDLLDVYAFWNSLGFSFGFCFFVFWVLGFAVFTLF